MCALLVANFLKLSKYNNNVGVGKNGCQNNSSMSPQEINVTLYFLCEKFGVRAEMNDENSIVS